MKLIYLSLLTAALSFSSCSVSTTNEEATKDTTSVSAEETTEDAELLAEHKCDATCEKEGCTGARCGEKGHECKASCHEKAEGETSGEESHEGHNH